MESVLEQQRKLHEERERLEDALVKERLLKKPTVSVLVNAYLGLTSVPPVIGNCVQLCLIAVPIGIAVQEVAVADL